MWRSGDHRAHHRSADEQHAVAHAPEGTVIGQAPDGREMLLVEFAAQWERWLDANHEEASGVWLVSWRSVTGRPRVSYDDAIDAALCVGWIDSQIKRMDDERTRLLYTPRRRGSVWSAPNKQRVARLAEAGRLRPAGVAAIERAKADGSWQALDAVDRMEVPDDLATALDATPGARAGFDAYSPSATRQVLYWVISAKRPETRSRRIAATVAAATEGLRPNGF